MKRKKSAGSVLCPCGSGKPLAECCGQFHAGVNALDAESLMRSRYSAYALGLEAYILSTWHASTRPHSLDLAADGGIRWISLHIEDGGSEGNFAWVLFTACYKVNGKAEKMTERSNFVKESGVWYYRDGVVDGVL